MEIKKENIRLVYGSAAGLALIVFSAGLYRAGINWYMSGFAYTGYLIILAAAVLAALRQKKMNGGWLEFSEGLKIIFSVLVIALLAQTIFTYFLMNYVDAGFKNAVKQASLEKMERFMRKFGIPDDQVDKAIDDERNKDEFSMLRISLGFATSCIFQFIIALILSAIVKKKKPEFPIG